MTPRTVTFPRHGLPTEVSSYAAWLSHVFSLGFRDVGLILAERGLIVMHESIWR
jgi:putative transposase